MCEKCKWRGICRLERNTCKYYIEDIEYPYETKLLDSIDYTLIMNAIDKMKNILTIQDIKRLAFELITEKRVYMYNKLNERGEITENEIEVARFIINHSSSCEDIEIENIKKYYTGSLMHFGGVISTLTRKKLIKSYEKKIKRKKVKMIKISHRLMGLINV